MAIIFDFVRQGVDLFNEMAPYLLLGFFIAGLLHVIVRKERISQWLGQDNFKSVFRASLFGIPLPLCSCGVIPTGVSFYQSGASRGSTVSFLISTPQTGVDSILATYSLLGAPFAIIRPIISLITGVLGGIGVNKFFNKTAFKTEPTSGHADDMNAGPKKNQEKNQEIEKKTTSASAHSHIQGVQIKTWQSNRIYRIFHYAFVEFLQDIADWLMIGIVIAALFAVLIPDNFFSMYLDNPFLSMFLVLLASIPLYVCATGSIPIAAVLMMKGLSPGAALVLLMAGPATNAATLTVVGRVMGKKTLLLYLASIVTGAVFFGVLINEFLPREWFALTQQQLSHAHGTHFISENVKIISGIVLFGLILNAYIQKFLLSRRIKHAEKSSMHQKNNKEDAMSEQMIQVGGMTCNHCKMNVMQAIQNVSGVDQAEVDLNKGFVKIKAENFSEQMNENIKNAVQSQGYEYKGIIQS